MNEQDLLRNTPEHYSFHGFHRKFIDVVSEPDGSFTWSFLSRFTELFSKIIPPELSEVADKIGHRIVWVLYVRMTADNLHYHSPGHIIAMLDFAEEHKIQLTNAEQLAIWFHDAIYEPDFKDNEFLSSQFMCALLTPYVDADLLAEASSLIGFTKFHLEETVTTRGDLIMDLDVSVFCYERENYKRMTDALRKEYPNITDRQFNAGRVDFLKKLLAKGYVFRSDVFKKFEHAALVNIHQDLDELNESLSTGCGSS